MNLWVFAITLSVFVVGQVIVGLRWWLLLRTQSIYISVAAAVRLNFLGWFYNNFMPGAVGGDLLRAWYVTKHTAKRFEAALSVFVDRVVGLFSTLVIAAFFYTVFLRNQAEKVTFAGRGDLLKLLTRYRWIFVSIMIVFGAVFFGMMVRTRGRFLLKRAWLYIRLQSYRIFVKLKSAAIVYFSKPLTILAAFCLTVVLQIAIITAFWLLGRDLGIPVGLKYYYVFFTLTWVLGAVPVSVGGAVVVEGTLAYLFIHYASVEAESALALVLCQRIVWILASLPGAVIHLIGAHLPKDFFVDYDKPAV
jgi:hypothetical protein